MSRLSSLLAVEKGLHSLSFMELYEVLSISPFDDEKTHTDSLFSSSMNSSLSSVPTLLLWCELIHKLCESVDSFQQLICSLHNHFVTHLTRFVCSSLPLVSFSTTKTLVVLLKTCWRQFRKIHLDPIQEALIPPSSSSSSSSSSTNGRWNLLRVLSELLKEENSDDNNSNSDKSLRTIALKCVNNKLLLSALTSSDSYHQFAALELIECLETVTTNTVENSCNFLHPISLLWQKQRQTEENHIEVSNFVRYKALLYVLNTFHAEKIDRSLFASSFAILVSQLDLFDILHASNKSSSSGDASSGHGTSCCDSNSSGYNEKADLCRVSFVVLLRLWRLIADSNTAYFQDHSLVQDNFTAILRSFTSLFAQKALFDVLWDADDILVTAMLELLLLYRFYSPKRLHLPSAEFVVQIFHPVWVFWDFLSRSGFDHTLLLDFLISDETQFLDYLLQFLKLLLNERFGLSLITNTEQTDCGLTWPQFQQLGKVMARLNISLQRLNRKHLLSYDASPLLRLLGRVVLAYDVPDEKDDLAEDAEEGDEGDAAEGDEGEEATYDEGDNACDQGDGDQLMTNTRL